MTPVCHRSARGGQLVFNARAGYSVSYQFSPIKVGDNASCERPPINFLKVKINQLRLYDSLETSRITLKTSQFTAKTSRITAKTSQITLIGQISPLGDLFVRYSIVARKIRINRRGIINSTANKIYFSN